MARLLYSMLCSLDGYAVDESGDFGWAQPDEQVHAAVNELMRPAGTQLYGRRLYEVMQFWETADQLPGMTGAPAEFATLWQATDKVVYSRTLTDAPTARTRIEREFDPDAVRALKESADRDLVIGGPELAARALRAGLVDEVHLFTFPVAVGGGTPVLPAGLRVELELTTVRQFDGGAVHLGYRLRA